MNELSKWERIINIYECEISKEIDFSSPCNSVDKAIEELVDHQEYCYTGKYQYSIKINAAQHAEPIWLHDEAKKLIAEREEEARLERQHERLERTY